MTSRDRGRLGPWSTAASLVVVFAALAGCDRPQKHIVEMRGMEFQPAVLEVHPGDTVTWVNRDITPHTATLAGRWDTGPLSQGAEGEFIARDKGEWSYVCTLHPTMNGKVVVR